jgi:hypothetical protein
VCGLPAGHVRLTCKLTCFKQSLLQAVAAVNAALAAGTFRRVIGKSVATTIQPAEDYYLAEVGVTGCVWERKKGREKGNEKFALLVGLVVREMDSSAVVRAMSGLCQHVLPSPCPRPLVTARPQEYHQQYLSKGGRFSSPQSAEKGCKDKIRCYG